MYIYKMSKSEEDSSCTKSKGRYDSNENRTESQDQKYDPLYFCRTCANKDSFFVPIFKEEGLNHQLHQKIEKYLPIHVTKDDDLPLQLCYNCASTIIAWDTLIIGCIDAENKLKSLKSGSHSYEHENKQNEKLDELHETATNNVDSDDEPLIAKKLSIIKNSKKRTNGKKQVAEDKVETSESHQENENEADRRSKSIHRCSVKSILANENEIVDNNRSVNDGDSSDRIPGTDVEIFDRKLTENETEHHCPVCFKTFSATTSFCEDLYSHLGDDPGVIVDEDKFKNCRICKEPLAKIRELLHHLLLHIDSKRTKSLKDRSFAGRKRKKKKKVQIDDPPFKSTCEICGKMISKKYTMKRHLITHSGEKRYTCHHCGKQYAQESGLQRHMSVIHEGIRKYKCPICSQIFGTNFELKTHQYTHTDPKPFQCDQCGRMFVCQKHLYHHRKYHHTANGLRRLCKICNKYFSSPGVLKRHHKVIHLGLKEFQCHVCSAHLSTKQYLQEHLKIHTDERPEVCSYCGKTFQMTGNLRQHLKIHLEKTQICDVCGKGFTRRCHLLTHMGSHKNIELPQCVYCQKRFILKIDLEKHLKSDHNLNTGEHNNCGNKKNNFKETSTVSSDTGQEKTNHRVENAPDKLLEVPQPFAIQEEYESGSEWSPDRTWTAVSLPKTQVRNSSQKDKRVFQCNICSKVLNRKFNFERHLLVHSGETLTCHACGKQYRGQSVLDRHIKVIHQQSRVSSINCDFCGKVFSSRQSLEDHYRTHTGERPYICEICGKDFRARPNLIAHKKIHSGNLPFACNLCNYKCRLKGTFIDHCQRHEGKRTCLCSICGKGFVNNYDLSKHKKTHSKDRIFSCTSCNLTFVMKRYLKVHMKTHVQKSEMDTTTFKSSFS